MNYTKDKDNMICVPISAISGHIDRTSFCRVSLLHYLCFFVNLLLSELLFSCIISPGYNHGQTKTGMTQLAELFNTKVLK